jgi:hypothetical protein
MLAGFFATDTLWFCAQRVLEKFSPFFAPYQLEQLIDEGYQSFTHTSVMPLSSLGKNTFMLEQWHGPTASFKFSSSSCLCLFHSLTHAMWQGFVASGCARLSLLLLRADVALRSCCQRCTASSIRTPRSSSRSKRNVGCWSPRLAIRALLRWTALDVIPCSLWW